MEQNELAIWQALNELPEVQAAVGEWWFIGDMFVGRFGKEN